MSQAEGEGSLEVTAMVRCRRVGGEVIKSDSLN